MPITPQPTNTSKRYGWWSAQAYYTIGNCSIYQRPDGSYITVTAVSSAPSCPYGPTSSFKDAQFLGEVTNWIVNPPSVSPMTGSSLIGPATWPAGSKLPYNVPSPYIPTLASSAGGSVKITAGSGASIPPYVGEPSNSKKPCDCPMNLLLRDGCRNPNHQQD